MPQSYTGPRQRVEQWLDEFFVELIQNGDVRQAAIAFRKAVLAMVNNCMTPGDLEMDIEEIEFWAAQVGLDYKAVERNARRAISRAHAA